MPTPSVQINRSLIDKVTNEFYVSFYQMDNNTANFLGRQVLSVERPTISFLISETHHKGKKHYHNERLDLAPITVMFSDDQNSLCTKAIYDQIYLHAGIKESVNDEVFDNSKFEMRVIVYNVSGENVEQFTLKGCFFSSVSHTEQVYSDTTKNVISASIQYDDISYEFPILDISLYDNHIIDELSNHLVDENNNHVVE